MMPFLPRVVPALLPAVALAVIGCGPPAAAPLAKAPQYQPKDQSKCSVQKSQSRPLIIEWPAPDRAALEALAKRGMVAVRYEGCEMELLAQCRAPGIYRYTPTTEKQETVTIRDVDDLYAKVPFGAAGLEAKLARSGELNVAMTIVGRYDAEDPGVTAPELEGICNRATHVITGLTVGAFEFYAGAAAAVGAGVNVAGVGAGARSGAERELLNRDGDAESCALVASDDVEPPEGCGALVRVEVAPLGAAVQIAKAAGDDGQPAVALSGSAAPAPAQVSGSIPPGPGIVKIHIDSPDPQVQLYGSEVDKLVPLPDGSFRSVGPSTILCRAPCDEYIDARNGQQVHLASPDMPPSDPFQLFASSGDVEVRVEPGDEAMRVTGGWLTALGVLGVLAGAPTLIGGAATESDEAMLIGGVILGPSVVALGVGIPLSIGGATDIEISPAPGLVPAPKPDP